jgi:hypothetical protein
MKNKILLSAAILAATSITSFAKVETFQVTVLPFAEPAIAEQEQLDFGSISPASGATCTMDDAGLITSGSCSGTTSLGEVQVSGLAALTQYKITVTGNGTDNALNFAASASASDATTLGVALSDGSVTSFTSDGAGSPIDIKVFGTITVGDDPLTASIAATADYTVDVSFE